MTMFAFDIMMMFLLIKPTLQFGNYLRKAFADIQYACKNWFGHNQKKCALLEEHSLIINQPIEILWQLSIICRQGTTLSLLTFTCRL